MLSREYNRDNFRRHTAEADITVVEGVMGLYDGYDGTSDAGSTAQMAKWLDLPVMLVVDARSMARSAAALVQGFEGFDPDLTFAGVLFNRVGSPGHLDYLRQAVDAHVSMPCLGGIPRRPEVAIPERHLGLVTADDFRLSHDMEMALADLVEGGMDLDALLAGGDEKTSERQAAPCAVDPAGVTIAVARDPAFCFYYPENIELLEHSGARISFFSPLEDSDLPEGTDGIYFGGGYPEVYAERLAANERIRLQIAEASEAGMPIYGECGGFMYLCHHLVDVTGKKFPMTGCFPWGSRMLDRRKALGYREITCVADTPVGPRGTVIRGHEFHYSTLEPLPGEMDTVYRITNRKGHTPLPEGYLSRRTLGSYVHLHFGSAPDAAASFVKHCAAYTAAEGSIA